jgi:hypothetical protein
MATNIMILIALILFEIGSKYVAGFYLLVLLQNYINFRGFCYLLRNLNTEENAMLVNSTDLYYYSMNLMYFLTFMISFTSSYGPFCRKTIYPAVLTFSSGLFVINALFHFYLHSRNYWLKWEEHPKIKLMVGRE